jgi:SHS2 domain-containing protein
LHRWVEHTAELELEIEAASEDAVFADALTALSELISDDGDRMSDRLEIQLESDDLEGLLADWLDELVYLADVQSFVPDRLIEIELAGHGLRATVGGHRGEPRPLVKAVTRHRLEFRPTERGWRARVVLDV